MDPNTESSPATLLSTYNAQVMDIRELYALRFSRSLSVTRLLNDPFPRDFKLFAIQTVSLAVTIWRRSASGKISGFFTKPSLFDHLMQFRTEMAKTETKGISSAKWILLSVIDYCFWRMLICQNLPYANRQFYFNVLLVLFVSFALSFPSIFFAHFPVFLSSKGENLTWTEQLVKSEIGSALYHSKLVVIFVCNSSRTDQNFQNELPDLCKDL